MLWYPLVCAYCGFRIMDSNILWLGSQVQFKRAWALGKFTMQKPFTMQKTLRTISHIFLWYNVKSPSAENNGIFFHRHIVGLFRNFVFFSWFAPNYFFKERFLEPFYVDFIEECFSAAFVTVLWLELFVISVNYKFLL